MSYVQLTDYFQAIIRFVNENAVSVILTSALAGAVVAVIFYFISAKKSGSPDTEAETVREPKSAKGRKVLTNNQMMELLLKGKGKINPNFVYSEPIVTKSEIEEPEKNKSENSTVPSDHVDSTPTDSVDSGDDTEVEEVSSSLQNKSSPNEKNPLDDEERITTALGKLHGKLNTAQLKVQTRLMTEKMTQEERDYEASMRAKQMESIMALMMENQEKFGMTNEEDIKEQLNLYNF